MSMKKIAIFTPVYSTFQGGLSHHIKMLEKFLNFHSSVFIFTPTLFHSSKVRQIFASFGWQIKSLFFKWNFDVVNIHTGPGGVIFFPFFRTGKLYYTVHHTYHQQIYFMKEWYKYLFFIFEKCLYKYSDKIITVSESTKLNLINYYGVDSKKIFILGNFCELPETLRIQKLKIPNTLLFIGRLDNRKNPLFCIDLLQDLKERGYNYTLFIVGTGVLFSACLRRVSLYGLSGMVVFHKSINECTKFNLMQESTYLIVPSIFEGQGVVCLEGIISNMSVLCRNTDGLRDICSTCNLFENLTDLSNKIISFSNNADLYQNSVRSGLFYRPDRKIFTEKLKIAYDL